MTLLIRAPHTLSLALLLAASACELKTNLGNLSATDTADGSTGDTAEPNESDSSTSNGATSGEPLTTGNSDATTGQQTTGQGSGEPWETTGSATDATTGIGTTGMSGRCDGLTEADCQAQNCMAHYGIAYDFPGCSEGMTYLGCTLPLDCDAAEMTFCKEGTEEAYKKTDACAPLGYVQCEPPTVAFCGSCEALSEAECLDEPTDCQPIYGAPHIEVRDMMCVDYANKEFLICIANGGACPPFIPTICPIGQPDKAYDSPSGCVPAGFEECDGAGTPECL